MNLRELIAEEDLSITSERILTVIADRLDALESRGAIQHENIEWVRLIDERDAAITERDEALQRSRVVKTQLDAEMLRSKRLDLDRGAAIARAKKEENDKHEALERAENEYARAEKAENERNNAAHSAADELVKRMRLVEAARAVVASRGPVRHAPTVRIVTAEALDALREHVK